MLKLRADRRRKGRRWKLLFDGKSLAGWRGYRAETAPTGWRAENGVLIRFGEGGDLMTAEQYGDFEMRWNGRSPTRATAALFTASARPSRIRGTPARSIKFLHNAGHADGKNPITSAGSNYAVNEPTKDASKEVGEWNEGRLVARGNHVEHWLNGVKSCNTKSASADWNARVKASKFGKIPP